MSYFSVCRPQADTSEGLFSLLESVLRNFGIESVTETTCKKLVGVAADGASANVAANRLKGLVEQQLNWIFWIWCLAHRCHKRRSERYYI